MELEAAETVEGQIAAEPEGRGSPHCGSLPGCPQLGLSSVAVNGEQFGIFLEVSGEL